MRLEMANWVGVMVLVVGFLRNPRMEDGDGCWFGMEEEEDEGGGGSDEVGLVVKLVVVVVVVVVLVLVLVVVVVVVVWNSINRSNLF